ncbi:MAG: immunoglobulin [Oscillospiraceae bacterium]|nr:immunoglobulin [Oscillospiraceae bacterium]
MKLSKIEQETILLYNEEEATASVYTHDPKLLAKLKRLSEKYPDKIYPERKEHPGTVSYIVPKSCVSIREPYSDARRKAASERAKTAGYMPPARSASPKKE